MHLYQHLTFFFITLLISGCQPTKDNIFGSEGERMHKACHELSQKGDSSNRFSNDWLRNFLYSCKRDNHMYQIEGKVTEIKTLDGLSTEEIALGAILEERNIWFYIPNEYSQSFSMNLFNNSDKQFSWIVAGLSSSNCDALETKSWDKLIRIEAPVYMPLPGMGGIINWDMPNGMATKEGCISILGAG